MNETAVQAAYHAHPVWAFVICYCATLVPATIWMVMTMDRHKDKAVEKSIGHAIKGLNPLELETLKAQAEANKAVAVQRLAEINRGFG